MGACASKNKQPKEEAYKPAAAPGSKPEFEEIVPDEKREVNSKSPVRVNGSAAATGDGCNSVVGPGGVILPNQPGKQDEADPSIPFIDASEDELENRSPLKARFPGASVVEAAVEAVDVSAVNAAVEEVEDAAATAESSATAAGEELVKEVQTGATAAAEEAVDKVKVVAEEVKAVASSAVEELQTKASDAANTAGSLVGDVMKSADPDKIAGEVAVEVDEVKTAVEEKVEVTFGKQTQMELEGVAQELVTGADDSKEDMAGFRLMSSEKTAAKAEDEQVASFCQSVGFLFSQHTTATGFRVGDKYIMTAYHVIRDIQDKMTAEEDVFDNKDVWIQFDYLPMGEYEFDNLTRFRFARIAYTNPELDVAVIELQADDRKTMPPPVANFCEIGDLVSLEVIGQDGAKNRQEPAGLLGQATEEELKEIAEWCQSKRFPPNAYSGMGGENRIRLQGAPQYGTSGSPCVVVRGDEIYVVAMVTDSYPRFYLALDDYQKQLVPDKILLQEGVATSLVQQDMDGRPDLEQLFSEIFSHSKTPS